MDARLPSAHSGELANQNRERDRLVRYAVSSLKNLADSMTGVTNQRALFERLAARTIATGVKTHSIHQAEKRAGEKQPSPIALAIRAEKELGPAFVDYEPETLAEALDLDADAVTRLMLMVHALYDPAAYTDWHVFAFAALAVNDRAIEFDVTPELSVSEIAWAADALRFIDPVTPWSPEVEAYVIANLLEEGFVSVPDSLAFAELALKARLDADGRALAQDMHHPRYTHEGVRLQQAKLSTVNAYVNARHQQLASELADLQAGK